eukprot:m51a1_g6784 hypothetical protein (814) ;mRNA; r:145063-154207
MHCNDDMWDSLVLPAALEFYNMMTDTSIAKDEKYKLMHMKPKEKTLNIDTVSASAVAYAPGHVAVASSGNTVLTCFDVAPLCQQITDAECASLAAEVARGASEAGGPARARGRALVSRHEGAPLCRVFFSGAQAPRQQGRLLLCAVDRLAVLWAWQWSPEDASWKELFSGPFALGDPSAVVADSVVLDPLSGNLLWVEGSVVVSRSLALGPCPSPRPCQGPASPPTPASLGPASRLGDACASGLEPLAVLPDSPDGLWVLGAGDVRFWPLRASTPASAVLATCPEAPQRVARAAVHPITRELVALDGSGAALFVCGQRADGSLSFAPLAELALPEGAGPAEALVLHRHSAVLHAMSTKRHESDHEASRAAVDAQLNTAWQLRTLVVPHMASSADLSLLALSFPAALRRACRVPRGLPASSPAEAAPLVRAFVSSCSPQRASPAACVAASWGLRAATLRALPPSSALLLAVCAAQSRSPRAVAAACEVVEGRWLGKMAECAALPALLAAMRSGSSRDIAAAVEGVAGCRGTCSLPRAVLTWCVRRADICAPLVVAACCLGSLDALDVLGSALSGMAPLNPDSGSAALVEACSTGSVEVVRRLAQPPYSLTGVHAMHGGSEPLRAAARLGFVGVVQVLGQPPYSLGEADPLSLGYALKEACYQHINVVEVLAQPPFNAAASSRAQDEALQVACHSGSPDIVRALCRHGPPFSLGHADAVADGCAAFVEACGRGNPEVVRLLAQEPLCFGRPEAEKARRAGLVEAATAEVAQNGASEAPEAPEQEEYQEEQQDDQNNINWNDMTTLASMGPTDVAE